MLVKTSFIAVVSVVFATVGQLLLKSGMEKVGYIGATRLSSPGRLAIKILTTPQVLIGLGFFGASAVVWLIVLSRVPLSFAYPFAGLVYLLITLFSKFVLKEQIPGLRWFGIAMIIGGILVVGRTAPPEPEERAGPAVTTPTSG